MVEPAWILCEPYAGLQAQALGLAEAAGLAPGLIELHPRFPWRHFPASVWPAPLRAVGMRTPPQGVLFTAGGTAAAVGAACRGPGRPVVQVQNPRMALRYFDLAVVNRHDNVTGPNVIVTRTALHRASQARLAAARAVWAPRFAHLPRPLVSVLTGGSNGRFRLGQPEGQALASQLVRLIERDGAGIALTPSRRTDPAVRAALAGALIPRGAYVWNMEGENPYFGLLACADVIVATIDSISMISEAAATTAPILLAPLPGRSTRIAHFLNTLRAEDRTRLFTGQLEFWPVIPLDDTAEAGAEVRRRLNL